jgi:hypothetical protein
MIDGMNGHLSTAISRSQLPQRLLERSSFSSQRCPEDKSRAERLDNGLERWRTWAQNSPPTKGERGAVVGEQYKHLLELLSRHAFRESFLQNPQGALETAGVDTSNINQDLINTLAELTPQELAVIPRVKTKLDALDVPPDDVMEMF